MAGRIFQTGTYQFGEKSNRSMPHPTPRILALPFPVLLIVLRFLLISPIPLVLSQSSVVSKHPKTIYPVILATCRAIHSVGLPILYGENIITASSPSTSYEFDAQLAALPGKQRQCIRYIRLEIDWGDQLWAKFPLVARYIGEIRGLRVLDITILQREETDKEVGTIVRKPRVRGWKREGLAAETMLKSEKKTFKDLIESLPALQKFRLVGFRDKDFARKLEGWIERGKRDV